MKNVEPSTEHFRFTPGPQHPQGGVLFTPFMGEVEPGRIYPVDAPDVAAMLRGHDEWEPVAKKDYDAQVKADKKESAHHEE